jgi:hypothetical protein
MRTYELGSCRQDGNANVALSRLRRRLAMLTVSDNPTDAYA